MENINVWTYYDCIWAYEAIFGTSYDNGLDECYLPMLASGEMGDVVHVQGEIEFKRGIIGKWRKAYCTVRPQTFTVYEDSSCETELFAFSPKESWVSAANKPDSGLFVLNIKPKDTSSPRSLELYLFDTKIQSSLIEWLKALKNAGWKSAVMGDRLRYHQRSVDPERVINFRESTLENFSIVEKIPGLVTDLSDCVAANPLSSDTNNNDPSRLSHSLSESKITLIESTVKGDNKAVFNVDNTRDLQISTFPYDEGTKTLEVGDENGIASFSLTFECDLTKGLNEDQRSPYTSQVNANTVPTQARKKAVPMKDEDIESSLHNPLEYEDLERLRSDSFSYAVSNDAKPAATTINIATLTRDTEELRRTNSEYLSTLEVDDSAVKREADCEVPVKTAYEEVPMCFTKERDSSTSQEMDDPSLHMNSIEGILSSESGYCSKESLSMGDDQKSSHSRSYIESGAKSAALAHHPDKAMDERKGADMKIKCIERFDDFSAQGKEREMQGDRKSELPLLKPEVLRKFQEVEPNHGKLIKRSSMTNILAQFKNKMSINKRKGNRKRDKLNPTTLFSTKLLWKDQSEWKDRWFHLEENRLFCFKDQGMKAEEFSIDIRKCVTSMAQESDMQGMNIFTLTTEDQVVYQLAAWSDHHLQNWIKALDKYSEAGIGSLKYDDEFCEPSESVIPYNEAIAIHSKTLRKSIVDSKKTSPGTLQRNERIEPLVSQGSMDSGNDGDESESGLESSGGSLSDIKQYTSRRKSQLNKRKMGIDHGDVSQSLIEPDDRSLEHGESTSDRADSLHTMPSFDDEDYDGRDIFKENKPLHVFSRRKTNSPEIDLNQNRLETNMYSLPVNTFGSTSSQSPGKIGGILSSEGQVNRGRQESTESSTSADFETSSTGSPTEKLIIVDSYRKHSSAISSRKYSVDSYTSLESEADSSLMSAKTKVCNRMRELGKEVQNTEVRKDPREDDSARRVLLAEVLRQRDNASKNLISRSRADSDGVRQRQPRANTMSGATVSRPVMKASGQLKRVFSQGILPGAQNWSVKIENVAKVTDDFETESSPLSPSDSKESLTLNSVDVKPVYIHSKTNSDSRISVSLGSEDSEDFFSLFSPESQAEFEKSVRNETLLRKRRNSLSLTRESIIKRLESIRRKTNGSEENNAFQTCISSLEAQLDDVNREITAIEASLSLQCEDLSDIAKRKRRMGKRANAVLSRLRHPLTGKSQNAQQRCDSSANSTQKESGFKLRKRSTSAIITVSNDGPFENRRKNGTGQQKKISTSSDPRPEGSLSSAGSSVDLRVLDDDVPDGPSNNTGLKTRSKSVGNILHLGFHGSNEASATVFESSKPLRQRKISMEAISKIEDFMEFSREMVTELKARKDSEEFTEAIEV